MEGFDGKKRSPVLWQVHALQIQNPTKAAPATAPSNSVAKVTAIERENPNASAPPFNGVNDAPLADADPLVPDEPAPVVAGGEVGEGATVVPN